jgi:ATP-binding cassette subfamily B protein
MNSSSLLRVRGERKYAIEPHTPNLKFFIIKLLILVARDPNLAAKFSQAWTPIINNPTISKIDTDKSLPLTTQPAQIAPEVEFFQNQNQRKSRFWRSSPFIQQQDSSDCGAACLAMICQYWGKRFSLNTLRNLAGVDAFGVSLQGLEIAAQTLGYDVLAVKASLSKLDLYYNPWIAHWQGIHYIVVWQMQGDRILIADPALGKRWLSRSEFEASWTGYALLLNPTAKLQELQSEEVVLSRYWQLFEQHQQLLQPIIIVSVLVAVFGLAFPLCTQFLLDQILPDKNFLTLNFFAIGFLILGIWRIIFTAQRQFLLDYLANQIDSDLMSNFISHMLQLPWQFFALRSVEDIMNRVEENRKIQIFFTRQAVATTLDAVMVLIYLGLMVSYNWQLTLLVLGWLLPIVGLGLVASPLLKGISREVLQVSAQQNSSVIEMITAITAVKTAAAEKPMQQHWQQDLVKMLRLQLQGQKLANNWQLINRLLNHLGSTAVLWFGTTLVLDGQMSLGQFVAFYLLTGNIIKPVLGLVQLWNELPEMLISLERLNDVLDTTPEENTTKPLQIIPRIRGEVYFENVSYHYHGTQESNSLQNITFKLKPGQTIGIFGESGAGKSTLVKLLTGLCRPQTGQIFLDGYDISQVSPASLRTHLGVVPQENFIFSGTILENITLHNSEFSLEQAIASAKLATIHPFIEELPLGYNTIVGEGGLMLSGGQRQKIAIARALMRNPKILVIDEANTALDATLEPRLPANFSQISQHRTTVILSQHLSTVRHTDYILVLDQGMLIEQGTHQELIALSGFYSHLTQLQSHLSSNPIEVVPNILETIES